MTWYKEMTEQQKREFKKVIKEIVSSVKTQSMIIKIKERVPQEPLLFLLTRMAYVRNEPESTLS